MQLVGTVFFNVNTIHALLDSQDTDEVNRLVWAPDFFGSIAFLIASHLAWLAVCQGWWRVPAGRRRLVGGRPQLRRIDLLHAVGHRVLHPHDDR